MSTPRSLRRTPTQARSRATVDRILEAGRTLLAREGYDGLSTNRVAAEAGVSPGSLYQYFADKGAIVDAIIERWGADLDRAIAASLVDRLHEEGPAMVRATADALLGALESSAPLLRVVAEELPARQHRDRLLALESRVVDLLTAYLAGRRGAVRAVRPAATAWVLIMAIEHLAVRWVLDRPPIEREDLLDEVVALCCGYLGLPDDGGRWAGTGSAS